ncbi:hypothetical protein GXP67_33720 [Rhodocytophaga rosea]|uniref:Uncharacterized protein n=1 Tax=Rhodocytophaga rosea TaxID=2704465 RepID=A0A6C0GWG7_9BACT|nr:hypothetical protein GXP67_33720 [Rhodocytophaga rosea]
MTGFLIVACCFTVSGQSRQEPVSSIGLRIEPLPITPKEFYIASIIDERVNRRTVGYLLSSSTNPEQPLSTYPVDLQGGSSQAIREFMLKSLPRNTRLRPVYVRLRECLITEKLAPRNRIDGQVVVSMSFAWKRDEDTVHLVDYIGGGASYNRAPNQIIAVEQALWQSMRSSLTFFNNWMNQQSAGSVSLAKSLTVSFTDYVRNPDQDTVFYATNRPLIWEDFRDKPRGSRFAASVFPSFAYEGSSQVVNGIVHVNIKLKVFVLKNSSWVRETAREPYGLNHEQRHFDIVKIVAERFKQKLHPDSLTVEDHNSEIHWKYIESFREMNRLQEQYDGETNHGLDRISQDLWNQRIEAELKELGVK